MRKQLARLTGLRWRAAKPARPIPAERGPSRKTENVPFELVTAVLSPFISEVTKEFLGRRRKDIQLKDLQRDVEQTMAAQADLAVNIDEIRKAVVVLARYLALTNSELFYLSENVLGLTERPSKDMAVRFTPAIAQFQGHVERRAVARRTEQARSVGRRQAQTWPETSSRAQQPTQGQELDDFFDGFNEEVMRARLERGDDN